jgi:hypothetical protein
MHLLGGLYQWLVFGVEDAAYDAARSVLADYSGTHPPPGLGVVVFCRPVTTGTPHSVRTLSIEMRLHRLRKVLRASVIIDDAQMGMTYRNAVFIRRKALR